MKEEQMKQKESRMKEEKVTLSVHLKEDVRETLEKVTDNFMATNKLLSENKKLLLKVIDNLIDKGINQTIS